MNIWLVNADMKNICTWWCTKEEAINYFKKECKDYNWTQWIMFDGDEEDHESCLSYLVAEENGYEFQVDIFPIYLDEKDI